MTAIAQRMRTAATSAAAFATNVTKIKNVSSRHFDRCAPPTAAAVCNAEAKQTARSIIVIRSSVAASTAVTGTIATLACAIR
jgi:hypothetical protein